MLLAAYPAAKHQTGLCHFLHILPTKNTGQKQGRTYIIVYGQRMVLWASHLAIFITLAKTVGTRYGAKPRRLRQEFCRVFIVNKDNDVYTPLMQEHELV